MVEPIRTEPRARQDIGQHLDRSQVIDALKHGNIYEVLKSLPANITLEDIKQYLRDQWNEYTSGLVQAEPLYAQDAEYPAPTPQMFPPHEAEVRMSTEEGGLFVDAISSVGTKAMMTKEAEAGNGSGRQGQESGPMSPEELAATAEGTLAEWEAFSERAVWSILENQMVVAVQKQTDEAIREADRLIAMAKQGLINPEFVLIALAKVNSAKNGAIFAGLSKKAFMLNEAGNRVAEELSRTRGTDFGQMTMAQSRTKDLNFQSQLTMMSMQQSTSNISSTVEQVHGMIGEINRTRREIIGKFEVR
ncbi:MAG: hypothetical protein HY540_02455 [Deltaproteobacteria bacterium]|nr:hypothetical protein [Deltaproteobacteria bacterium]